MTAEAAQTDGDRHDVDVLIFGGGVAGLWLLTDLRQRGYRALLLEAQALGTGQTIWSQGIIHGGMKYALTGEMSKAARAIADMPGVWRDCLAGRGAIDLSGVHVLSEQQYLWTTGGAAARLGAFAASKVLRARPRAVNERERPAALAGAAPSARVYRLDEPVLDMRSLLAFLAEQNAGALLHVPSDAIDFHVEGGRHCVSITGAGPGSAAMRLRPRAIVLTAGAGNEALGATLGIADAPMQRRPLHQVLVRGDLPPLFGHAVAGLSDKPRLTITSAAADNGETVWNIGGDIAETGVPRSAAEQRAAAATALAEALPSLDFSNVRLSTQLVDRVEPRMPGGRRPDLPFVHRAGSVFVCWPTKLAFAPRLAAEVRSGLANADIDPSAAPALPGGLQSPPIATPPWDEADRRWHPV